MIFSRQEKASITLGISSFLTLVTNSCKFKTENKTHQVSQISNLAPGKIKNMLSPLKFKRETKNGKTKTIHVKLVKFNFLVIPAKRCFYLNTSNIFTNPAFTVLNC